MAAPTTAIPATPPVTSITPATQSAHFQVREDGKLYIGNKACTVKRADVEIVDRAHLQAIADIFNKTIAVPIQIEDGEVWKVKPEGITTFTKAQDGSLQPKNKQVPFLSNEAKDEFFRQIKALLERLAQIQQEKAQSTR
jgi:hypothetical protein